MELKLMAAYLALQLDPSNDEQTAAFEALCWKHVLHHTSSLWVQQAQSGVLPLVLEVKPAAYMKKKICGYDHTLDRLTFEFVQGYADAIWPPAEDKRSHLTAKGERQRDLKAVPAYMRAGTSVQARLEHDMERPCTEQMIVVKSLLGRKVREFLKELVRTRAAPSVDGYSAEQALQTVLGSVEPRRSRMIAARIPCPHPECITTHPGSEALTAHLSLLHATVGPSLPDTTIDFQTLPASNVSTIQDDTRTPVPRSMSARGLSQRSDTQMGSMSPVYVSVKPSHQAAQVDDPGPKDTSMHSPIILSDDEDGEGDVGGLLPMLPEYWTGTQTGPMVSVPSSIAMPHEADPMDDSHRYTADVLSLMSSDDDEDDSEGDVSGLLCPHSGCQLRLLDWASFDEHAQLPHNDNHRVSRGGGMFTTKTVTHSDDLHEAMNTSEDERNGNEVPNTRVQQGFLKGSVSGGTQLWRNMAGERI